MKTIFLQELTGGLFGGLLNGLLNRRFKGLFARTPVLAVLLLTAVIAACASDDSKSSDSPPSPPPPPTTKADCVFDEGAAAAVDGYTGCELFAFPQVPQVIGSDNITYNVTAGVINKGSNDSFGDNNRFESAVSNFIFTQIINGNTSNPRVVGSTNNNQLTLSVNATALNITFRGIHADLFGEFYIELVKSDEPAVKVRYTITITAVNDAPVFEAVMGSESQFNEANETTATSANYTFADIPFNSTDGYSVGNVSASDVDNDTITYGIDDKYSINGSTSKVENTLFQINQDTGEITLKAIVDADSAGDYTFNVTASDSKGGGVVAEIAVNVLPDYQAPMFRAVRGSGQFTPAAGATPANYIFADLHISSPAGSSVGNVSATDANNDAISYNISDEYNINGSTTVSNDLFQINPTTGEITLIREAAANNLGEYTFNATATDDQGESTEATIFVNIDDITPPAFSRTPYNFDLSLSMANAAGVVVGNVLVMEPEETPFTYSLVGSGDLFEFADSSNPDGTRSIILGRPATLSDFAEPSVTFQVVATHTIGGLSSEEDITVTLINDLPFDDDSDSDGIVDFYDADPNDVAVNVMGDGEPGNPYIISNIYQLQAIAGVDHAGNALDLSVFTNYTFLYGTNAADQLTKHYELANDINASATTDTTVWTKPPVTGYSGNGWTPIAGNSGQSFSGSFNGDGYAINSLEISARQSDNSKHFGLFGINNGNITALGLQNINMIIQAEGNNYQGTTIVGNITLGSHAGGLVALNQEDGIISYSYTTGLVNASMDAIGGLVGLNQGEISYSYSTATVQGAGDTGGLVGTNEGGATLSSYATGDVRGSYGISSRTGTAGGLVGSISGGGAIINTSYATGLVSDTTDGTAEQSSSGGVVAERGQTGVTIASSYWDNQTTNQLLGVDHRRDNTDEEGNETGTAPFTTAQLTGCQLDATPIAGVDPVPDCTGLFPSSHWAPNTDTAASIRREWIFRPVNYPSLSAFRTSGGPNKQLMPSLLDQQCHRNGMPLGC